MLENLKQVIENLEKSLEMLTHKNDVELLEHPEYLQAMKEIVQSINRVTRTLKELESSAASQRDQESGGKEVQQEKPGSRSRIHKPVKKNKGDDRRASSKS
ncbi:MAG: hypothetical protein GWM98_17620 [Nitrospinaceae bacterium]|nr:hypothetical protein [Nitrospinaceae bacterium]NIR55968.1 hypothetical protein [Nitrospinaceae bacterium]NIS86411.1 hypothetical protein [Nitrospinaceae bacterium]NIT83249.1 hypothetical protein [Nitrospinaceae bacterium]NIU45456.1 hypothetical protein [Nitrospinaceae bacterium]